LTWIIKYTDTAVTQLKKIVKPVAVRLLDYMDQRVATAEDPRSLGKNLVGPKLGEYWRYRVGDTRVICKIQDDQVCILVIEIGSRREVYR
jgi:mRNA interferase RelE/StbE